MLQGIPALGGAIYTFLPVYDIPPEIHQSYFVANMMTRLIPVLFIGGGLYLLMGGENIYRFAYPQEEVSDTFGENFLLALKIFGIYVIITYLPALLEDIAKLVTQMTAPEIYRVFTEQEVDIAEAVTHSASLALGLYLLRSGKIFMKYGLKGRNQQGEE